MHQKIHFVSLGCARNLVDTEVMLGLVMEKGFEIVPDIKPADFLVINTCGFLKEARDEAYAHIEELFSKKKKSAKVIVAGCMVKKEKEALKERFPAIHYFLGTGDVEKILDAIASKGQGEALSKEKSYLQGTHVPRVISTGGTYAFLKIAEGCAKRCSYCAIPAIKGPLKSKPLDQVVAEFSALLDQGVFEVILIAQDLGDYGKDRGDKQGLEALLRALLKEKRPFWLRLLYLYPDEITDGLIDIIESDARICPYLDMPIQHVNNDLLKTMRRRTSKEQIIEVMQKLRNRLPEVVIRTSLLVGFPGETEAQFEELLSFIQEHPLDHIGVFAYSQELDTVAGKMEGQLEEGVKEERRERLMEAQKKIVASKNRTFIGKKIKVLVEGHHPESDLLLVGRHAGQAPDVDGCVILNEWNKVKEFGKIYVVQVSDAHDYDLVGRCR